MRQFSFGFIFIHSMILLIGLLILGLTACSPYSSQAMATISIAPPTIPIQEQPAAAVSVSTIPPPATPTLICNDNLLFIDDVTIPDNTVVSPGIMLDKQWLVQNNGNCNWDDHYRLRLISGDALGSSPEQALYPARAGTQAGLRILFTSPQKAGVYVSEWQAFAPNGLPFGESFYIKIIVK